MGGDTGALTCAAVGSNDPRVAEHPPGWPRPELLGRAGGQDPACKSHPPVHVAATEVRKGGDGRAGSTGSGAQVTGLRPSAPGGGLVEPEAP